MDKYTIAPPSGSTNNSVGAADRPWHEGHFGSVKLNGGDLGTYLAESTGYGIVSGCEPSISGLTVTVGAGVVHLSDGTRKEIAETNITLDNADSTNPRIDLVYIDSTGTVAKITGTASASPSVPTLPTGGISVALVSVAAGATTGIVTDSRDFALVTNKNVMTVKEARVNRIDAGSVTKPITACHRGYKNGDDFRAIENTIFALGDAERAGFQGVEIDFRKDVNGKIVCLHDATVDRVTDGTGNIADIAYTSVHLLNKYGQSTDNYLSTIEEIVTMAKVWDMWLIVDGSKGICSMPELITLFDTYNYHNYVFFEYENDSETSPELYYQQYLNTPKGIRIVLDPPNHSITNESLTVIKTLFSDRVEDVYIRTFGGDTSYFTLIKSYGFKIMYNTNDNISVPPSIPLVDIILSEESIYQRYPSKLIAKSNSMQDAYFNAVKETLSTFMVRAKTGMITDWPWTGINNACGMQYRNANGNYGFQLGFAFENTITYRNRRDGNWGKWYAPINRVANSETGIPTSGTYQKGDIIMNPSPTAGGYIGWVCVTKGTPGTWKGFGLIES